MRSTILSLHGVQAVLFDAVGTLIHPNPPAIEVYHRVGLAHGAELSLEEIGERFRAGFAAAFADSVFAPTNHAAEHAKWRNVMAAVFRETSAPIETAFAELWEHFARSENWSLFPEVSKVWCELEARGYILGVASNYDDRLPGVLARMPPLDACLNLHWSSRVGYAKPHPQFFQAVEKSLLLRPEQILLVGDDWQNDYRGATRAGWQAVFLDRKNPVTATPAIGSLAELSLLKDAT